MNKGMGRRWLLALGLIAVAGVGIRAVAQNPASQNAEEGQREQMMQCPMMQAMQSLKLPADAPSVLLAQEERLELSEQQKQRLRQIAETARQQARETLNDPGIELLTKCGRSNARHAVGSCVRGFIYGCR